MTVLSMLIKGCGFQEYLKYCYEFLAGIIFLLS